MLSYPRYGIFGMRNSGFTLIELLVALAILAIISAIAIPLYTAYSERTFRSQAQSDLLNCAQALERFASNSFSYVGAADSDADGVPDAEDGPIATQICDPLSVRDNRYTFALDAEPTTFVITATPQNAMEGDGILEYSNAGVRGWDRDGNDAVEADEETWEE